MRPEIITTVIMSVAILTRSAASAAAPDADGARLRVYVGTYTGEKSKGVYQFSLETGQPPRLVPLGLAVESTSPAFLEADLKRHLLFAVNEVPSLEGKPTGGVSSFKLDPTTGKASLLNTVPSKGAGPCHLCLDKTGRSLLIANYNSGSVAVIRVEPDGRLGEATDFIQHTGSSVNRDRQQGPHAHCATLDHANRFAFICDLGLDKILIYRFDAERGKLTPNEPAFASVKPGAGPRHMAFRPDGRYAYVINEMASTVTAFAYDSASGSLTEVQTLSTLPKDFSGHNSGAEIAVHPNGKFLYASNRGRDSVAIFKIAPDKGTLECIGEQSSGGKTPRHFGLDPSGKYLAIANQNSGNILVCGIDSATGLLQPSSALVEAPSPVCVLFVPPVKQ